MLRRTCCCLLSLAVVWGFSMARGGDSSAPTHKQVREIRVPSEAGNGLQTMSITPDGLLAALVGPPKYGNVRAKGGDGKEAPVVCEVHLYNDQGEAVGRWPVKFHGQSIAAGPDGSVFVGGDGRLAKFDKTGKLVAELELPHLADMLKDGGALRKRAEEYVASMKDSVKATRDSIDEQKQALQKKLDELKEKDAAELTVSQKRRIKRYEEQLKELDTISVEFAEPSIDDAIRDITSRMRMINGVAVTEKDVYIVCGEMKGYGYAVWRMDHQFHDPTQVLTGLGGCCGQMDVQAAGDDIFVAENTKHRVGHYDRDGNKVNAFGQRAEGKNDNGFGGCCNPMNLRIGKNGDVYTAESEGIIRRFSQEGEFLDLVGTAKLEHGCKNVAVAVSPDGDKVYFCDQPGSKIIVLAREAGSAPAAAEAGGASDSK